LESTPAVEARVSFFRHPGSLWKCRRQRLPDGREVQRLIESLARSGSCFDAMAYGKPVSTFAGIALES
jgi:hypothetical protein